MAQVLIVEDDKDLRAVLRLSLEQRGHHVAEAANGWEALLALDEVGADQIDLVLLDILMPGMNGATFLNIVRNAGSRREALPVVVMSVLDSADVRARIGQLAVTGIVEKRYGKLEDVLDRIDHYLAPPADQPPN